MCWLPKAEAEIETKRIREEKEDKMFRGNTKIRHSTSFIISVRITETMPQCGVETWGEKDATE